MVLHGIALYDLVSYVIYFAYFCVFRFVARALSRKTPIPSIHPSGSAHPSDSFGSSGSADPSESIHPSHLDHPAHPAQSTHPVCYLLFVIWYFLSAPKASEASKGAFYLCTAVLSGYCCACGRGYCKYNHGPFHQLSSIWGVVGNVPNLGAEVTLFDATGLLLILMIFHYKSMVSSY